MSIGKRIKFFRKRNSNMSQLDLELKTGLSQGVLSRIENGLISPHRDTVISISKALDLSSVEQDYLIGESSFPVTYEEIERAKLEAKDYLSRRGVLAYMLDDRWRFYSISDTFIKILKITPDEYDYVIGKTTVQLIVRDDSPVLSRIDSKHYHELLTSYLPFYYAFMSHMHDDEIYMQSVEDIKKNKLASEIWSKLRYDKDRNFTSQEERVIYFDLFGRKFPLYYSLEPLIKNSRFNIIEYTTKNRILDMIPGLL